MSQSKEEAVKQRIERIEVRLAKVPDDLTSGALRGKGLEQLVGDLRWAVAELKWARTDIEILRRFDRANMGSIFERIFGRTA